MSSEPFIHRIRARYHETDAQKYLFNSRYLEYTDVAMTEFFRDLGWSYPQMLEEGFDPSVVQTSLEFTRPVRLDDLVDVQVGCTRVGTSSFTLRFELSVGRHQVCRVESIYVNVDPDAEAARPIPEQIALRLRSAESATTPSSSVGART
ncbi:thioesterase family protein [Arthrobacter sp. M4]|uniref:acyl-CoA thioesterase n=1 Tax=Arthrobacter sp. M4 TaxID=218160 RepID=UPI001CDD59E5|nr:thioesterase family protein [Arthrobacter sp. M4]MCA4134821.1 acyl-CoA thioesterase [Arthrobacter sp. M4]